jgi:hypothetical protein
MPVLPITKKQAYNLGGRKAIRSFLAVFLIFEAFMLFVETSGDFANGILFFISRQADPFTLGLYILILLFSFLFGRLAGKKILIDNKNHILMALLFASCVTLLLLGGLYAITFDKHIIIERMSPLIYTIAATQLAIWLPTTWAIRRSTIARD